MRSLIVEDNLVNSKYLFKLLKPFGHADIAETGKAAIDKYSEALSNSEQYDLICLDVMMPVMDGQETLKRIRKLEEAHGIYGLDGAKVIMTTALDDKKTILQSFKFGCESYLIKPINKTALVEELKKLNLLKDTDKAKK